MKLFGHDFQGISKALVIFVAVFLVASGVCGLEIAVASQMHGNSASNLIPLGILDLIVMVVSGLGIVVLLLFLLIRAVFRSFSDPAKDDMPTLRDGDENSKR
jgi:hypothetical protein